MASVDTIKFEKYEKLQKMHHLLKCTFTFKPLIKLMYGFFLLTLLSECLT